MTDNSTKLITIKEARKLLGKEYSQISDEEIQKLIGDLSRLADLTLEDARKKLAKDKLSPKKITRGIAGFELD